MDFQDKKTLFNVRKTLLEMIQDRGYLIPENIQSITFEQFVLMYDNKNLDIFINDVNKGKLYIHFYNEVKAFGKNDLKTIFQKVTTTYEDENITIILLLREKENNAVTKELTKETYKNVEIFLKKYMRFNITHHILVPKHIVLTPEEELEVCEKYNTTKNKLPKISKLDPVAKYHGMKTDQICKIIRKSPEVGESIYYRVVK